MSRADQSLRRVPGLVKFYEVKLTANP